LKLERKSLAINVVFVLVFGQGTYEYASTPDSIYRVVAASMMFAGLIFFLARIVMQLRGKT
jgi:hypothetical protein